MYGQREQRRRRSFVRRFSFSFRGKSRKFSQSSQQRTGKPQVEAQLVTLQKNADVAHGNADMMRQMYDKLKADIESLETRKSTIKATESMAKAQERMNDITSGGDKAAASLEAFDRMEQKANQHLDEAMAEAELSCESDSADDLVKQYASGGSSSDVDEELAAMKAKLGL